MQNLLDVLLKTLKNDERLLVDGKLAKNKIVELALAMDEGLITLLIKNKTIKKHFFKKAGEALVFDKVVFQSFVSNKEFLPDSYTAFKNKVGLTANKEYLTESKEVVLAWAYKDCMLEGGQTKEDQKRDEIFWNETLAPDEIDRLLEPKVLTSFKKYDANGEHAVKSISTDDNLFIKGNNLLTLHSLENQYTKKIKLVYIDPPYNTGGDANIFTYNNTFNHSTWLTFIKNRVEIAKALLTDDGFIAVAIDHAELFYLGVLLDEVFGEHNRIAIVTVQHNPKGRNQDKFFSNNSEYMLVYAKNRELANFNQVAIDDDVIETFNLEDEKGKYRKESYIRARTEWSRENRPNNWYPIYVSKDLKKITSTKTPNYHEIFSTTNSGDFSWKNVKETFDELNKGDYFSATEENGKIFLHHKYYEQQVLKNVWTQKKYQSEFHGTNLLKKLIGKTKFSYPKSLYTVLDTIKIMTKPGDIVLDFFGGSSTTAHAVLQLNSENLAEPRRFIIAEQLDEHINVSIKRLNTVMKLNKSSDSFIYSELANHNSKIIGEIEKAKSTNDIKLILKEVEKSDFISHKIKPQSINKNIKEFEKLSIGEQKQFLLTVLDKNQLYVNYSEINDKDYKVSKEDKALNKQFYDEA
jgi:adenine-specific DNA-methyltransferase